MGEYRISAVGLLCGITTGFILWSLFAVSSTRASVSGLVDPYADPAETSGDEVASGAGSCAVYVSNLGAGGGRIGSLVGLFADVGGGSTVDSERKSLGSRVLVFPFASLYRFVNASILVDFIFWLVSCSLVGLVLVLAGVNGGRCICFFTGVYK